MEKKVPGTHEETEGSRPAASTSPPGLPNQSANAVDPHAHVPDAHSSVEPAHPTGSSRKAPSWRTWAMISVAIIGLAIGARFLVPWVTTALNTVSTDDAYVNGHVTFVAPRVAGQVRKGLVDDNYRVKRGDLLVQLDKEPYEVQLAIKQSAVTAADSDLQAAKAQVQALLGQTRPNRFKLHHPLMD